MNTSFNTKISAANTYSFNTKGIGIAKKASIDISSKGFDILSELNSSNENSSPKLTKEQKSYLRGKYDITNMRLQSKEANDLMSELANMGVITSEEADSFANPSIMIDMTKYSPEGVGPTVRVEEGDDNNLYKIFSNFAKLQAKSANLAIGKSRSDLLESADMYNKLSGILAEIYFN